MRRWALASLLSAAALVQASACSRGEDEPEGRFLEGGPSTREASAEDAVTERDVPCDGLTSPCTDASTDAALEDGEASVCPSPNACATARDIGKVSGDNNADQVSAMGTTSEWLSVRVTEDSTVAGASLEAKVTLVSPVGANFDLFVYFDRLSDVVRCTPPASASSTQQAGISDSASLVWGEGAVPNGSDDSRTLRIEVRHVSGECKAGAAWTLIVQGNTN